jgi:hypothetical protein
MNRGCAISFSTSFGISAEGRFASITEALEEITNIPHQGREAA